MAYGWRGEGLSGDGELERMRFARRADSIGRTYQDDSERSSRRKANERRRGWRGNLDGLGQHVNDARRLNRYDQGGQHLNDHYRLNRHDRSGNFPPEQLRPLINGKANFV